MIALSRKSNIINLYLKNKAASAFTQGQNHTVMGKLENCENKKLILTKPEYISLFVA